MLAKIIEEVSTARGESSFFLIAADCTNMKDSLIKGASFIILITRRFSKICVCKPGIHTNFNTSGLIYFFCVFIFTIFGNFPPFLSSSTVLPSVSCTGDVSC
jgi:hypothetical protein